MVEPALAGLERDGELHWPLAFVAHRESQGGMRGEVLLHQRMEDHRLVLGAPGDADFDRACAGAIGFGEHAHLGGIAVLHRTALPTRSREPMGFASAGAGQRCRRPGGRRCDDRLGRRRRHRGGFWRGSGRRSRGRCWCRSDRSRRSDGDRLRGFGRRRHRLGGTRLARGIAAADQQGREQDWQVMTHDDLASGTSVPPRARRVRRDRAWWRNATDPRWAGRTSAPWARRS